ncbi:unnamed protein product [Prunus armeniaca]
MRIIKNRLRSTIADEFLADCMILRIKIESVNNIDNEEIIEEFKISMPHRWAGDYVGAQFHAMQVNEKTSQGRASIV